jgi:3-oxoacyl-[acyl-carrier protein] reductase
MSVQSVHAFAEKVSLVTDASSPLGRAAALQLALLGSYVIVGYCKSTPEIERVMDELNSLGTLAAAVEADTSTREGARKLLENVDERFGRLDLLVNCLKSERYSSFEETTNELFAEAVRADLGSAFFTIQAALPLMAPRPGPRIVNVVYEGRRENVLAVPLREAVKELTGSLATILPKHFRINAVEVSGAETAQRSGFDPELIRPVTGVSSDDAARAILYLLSSEAKAINGQTLMVA